MPNYGYHLARVQGSATRRGYAAMLPTLLRRPVEVAGDLPLDVYAYSGEAALPEQVASIRSFLKNAGRPSTFTVVSDGTYSQRSLELLRRLDRSVAVSDAADWIPDNAPVDVLPYLREHPTGKQLAVIMSLPVDRPAFYVDSDVLFFPGATNLRALTEIPDAPALYLTDCQLSGDERLFRSDAERDHPVNTGVLLLFQKLDWSLAFERFRELNAAPTFFTNQTMTHLAMHANGARPFDPRTFVLQLDDQFIYRDSYAGADLVLRHYVNPVRHKFWTDLWR